MSHAPVEIRSVGDDERSWLADLLTREWGSVRVVSRGKLRSALELPGFAALWKSEYAGAITYEIDGAECEVITLNSLREGIGIGTALLAAVQDAARSADCRRLWLVTTNDNIEAQRFYERRGFRRVAVHLDAVTAARTLKPELPLMGRHGVPMRDEIEYELPLA